MAGASRTGSAFPPIRSFRDYPLMTTLIAVTDAPATAGEKVAVKLVPDAGVVPVASPREALLVPASVTL
jgi:hypothetical protein